MSLQVLHHQESVRTFPDYLYKIFLYGMHTRARYHDFSFTVQSQKLMPGLSCFLIVWLANFIIIYMQWRLTRREAQAESDSTFIYDSIQRYNKVIMTMMSKELLHNDIILISSLIIMTCLKFSLILGTSI